MMDGSKFGLYEADFSAVNRINLGYVWRWRKVGGKRVRTKCLGVELTDIAGLSLHKQRVVWQCEIELH